MKYKKTAPVRLKRIEEDREIETLEGKKTVRAEEDFLAKGVDGEEWPIPVEKVKVEYTKLLLPEDDEGFSKYKSNRTVTAELLEEDAEIDGMTGKAGKDYRVSDGKGDTWFVKKDIFEKTYTKENE